MLPLDRTGQRPSNSILSSLSPSAFAAVACDLEAVDLPFRFRLQETNRHIKHVYFPESGLASVVATSGKDRRQAEIGIIGNEGLSGIAAILEASRSPCEIFMQIEGKGRRIEVGKLAVALDSNRDLRRSIAHAIHVFQVQSSFNALANAQGKIDERLSRWLLMAQDRVARATLEMTHEFLALMLGVRRAGVTVAMHQLELRGLISPVRGAVTIVDRKGLEEMASGLYGQPEAEFERLFVEGHARH